MEFNGASHFDARHSVFNFYNRKARGKQTLDRFFGNRDNVIRTGLLAPSEASQTVTTMEIEPKSPPNQRPTVPQIDVSSLPQQEDHSYYSFPPPPTSIVIEPDPINLRLLLPMERAIALCDILLARLVWMFSIVSRDYLVEELIPAVYYPNRMHSRTCSHHDLALLLTALAIGVLVDLDLEPHNEAAQLYIRLAWSAAGSLRAVPTISTVKCLQLMSIYHGMAGNKSDSHRLLISAWQRFRHINLHEDPLIRGIEGKEAYDRRTYFWNLLRPILWQSLMTGNRPPVLATPNDCNILSEQDEEDYDKREALRLGAWSSEFTYQCLLPVTNTVLDPNPPDYKVILALDERIRAFPILSSSSNNPDLPSIMQCSLYSHYRELVLIFLHRDSFKRALTDNPMDPLASTYSYSFTTTYECACVMLDSTNLYANAKSLISRVWRFWSSLFYATVVIGAVAILTPNANLEPCPLRKLEDACALFEKTAKASIYASSALPKLLKMLDSAFHSAGQVMPMRHVTHVDDPQGDNAVFEDIWSERMYEEVMQAAQTHISD